MVPFLAAYFEPGGEIAAYQAYREATGEVRDLFVCTHGTVDLCCGKFGYPLYQALRDQYASPKLRAWRVSHFGGHAFAPTLIDMPSCRWWGHLEVAHLDALVHRAAPASTLRDCYRGWGALSYFGQIAEREIFMREGWNWADLPKSEAMIDVHGPCDALASPRFAQEPSVGVSVRIECQHANQVVAYPR